MLFKIFKKKTPKSNDIRTWEFAFIELNRINPKDRTTVYKSLVFMYLDSIKMKISIVQWHRLTS